MHDPCFIVGQRPDSVVLEQLGNFVGEDSPLYSRQTFTFPDMLVFGLVVGFVRVEQVLPFLLKHCRKERVIRMIELDDQCARWSILDKPRVRWVCVEFRVVADPYL